MIDNLRALPIIERMGLVEGLWDSIAVDQSMLILTDERRTELDGRLGAYGFDGVEGRIGSGVIGGIRNRL